MRTVVVFGRQPVPGRVKTRLATGVGAETAAAIYDLLLRQTVCVARAVGYPVVLSLAEPWTEGWQPPADVSLEVQTGGDLGERMGEGFARRFREGCEEVLLIGSDCPEVSDRRLAGAFDELSTHTGVVLGPAADGGYWLVGQRAPGVEIFNDVPWSSPRTLDATRDRLREIAVPWTEVDELRDVDTADDLSRLAAEGRLPKTFEAAVRLLVDGLPRAI